jgi:AraC-like DNA-binding protein
MIGKGVLLPTEVRSLRIYRTVGLLKGGDTIGAGFCVHGEVPQKKIGGVYPRLSMMYILDGSGLYVDPRGRSHKLMPGMLVFRPKDTPCSTYRTADGRWAEYFIVFPRALELFLLSSGLIDLEAPVGNPGVDRAHLDRMICYTRWLAAAADDQMGEAMLEAGRIVGDLMKLHRMRTCGTATNRSPGIIRACELISERLDKKVSMQQLSHQVGLGYANFRRLFKQQMGCSPRDYCIRWRIEKAKQMLSGSRLRIKEVAAHLGYPDVASFSKQFKKITGMYPGGFQRW